MKILVRDEAAQDLERIHAWIAQDNAQAAGAMIDRLLRRISALAEAGMPNLGRPGREVGTRELVEPPYVIVYEVDDAGEQITVLAVFHGRQDR